MSHDRLTDEQLVARFRAGDQGAFRAIDDRYRAPLLGFARRLLHGTGHDADDVVQDALIRAHAALPASDRPMALRPWLHTIVRHRALDALRAPQRTTGTLPEERHLSLVAEADPVERALRREELRAVVDAIGELPPRQRAALVGRELCGTRHAELAERLDTTVQGTKSLVIRARTTLRAQAS